MATYYVKNGGSNAATGLSDALAWATLAKAEATVAAGDTLLLKRGSKWREDFTTPVNNLTFDAYGSGALPIIDGSAVVTMAPTSGGGAPAHTFRGTPSTQPYVVSVNNARWNKGPSLAGLTNGQWFYTGGFLYVRDDTDLLASKTVEAGVRDSTIFTQGHPGVTVRHLQLQKTNGRIVRWAAGSNNGVCEDCVVRCGGSSSSNGGIEFSISTGCRASRNTVTDVQTDGIYCLNNTGGIVEDNVIDTCYGPYSDNIQFDFFPNQWANANPIVRRNDCSMLGTDSPKGNIIVFGDGALIEDNNCEYGGFGVSCNGSDSIVRRNRGYRNGEYVPWGGSFYADAVLGDPSGGFAVVDNQTWEENVSHESLRGFVFYGTNITRTALKVLRNQVTGASVAAFATTIPVNGQLLDNVLCADAGGKAIDFSSVAGGGTWQSDRNTLGPQSTGFVRYEGVTYDTLAAYVFGEARDAASSVGGWPAGWPAWPTMPTLTVLPNGTAYSTTRSNVEYRNLGTTAAPADVTMNPNGETVQNVRFRDCVFDYLDVGDGSYNIEFVNCTVKGQAARADTVPTPPGPYSTPMNVRNHTGNSGIATPRPRFIKWIGGSIQDAARPHANDDIHIEGAHITNVDCFWMTGGTRAFNNSLNNISFQNWGTPAEFSLDHILLEQLDFDGCRTGGVGDHDQASIAVQLTAQGSPRNFVIRDSFVRVHGLAIDPGIPAGQNVVAGNNRNEFGTLLPSRGTLPDTMTVTINVPQSSQTMTTNPVTVQGVASATGSTTITVRVYDSSNALVHSTTATRSGRNWAATLSGFTFTTGSWRLQAQQDATLSNNRLFTFLVVARKQIALPAGPSASWHNLATNPSTGSPGGQTVIATGVNSPHRFAQAADFYDSVGINSHVIYNGPYARGTGGMDTYLDRLQELGIRHIRDGLWSPATSNVGDQWAQVAALGQKVRARNVATTDQTKKLQMLWGTPKEPASMPAGYQYTVTPTNGTFLRPLDGPGGNGYTTIGWYDVACLQGPNEPGYTWTPNWTDFRRIIRALKDAKNARTAVGAFSGTEWIDFTTGRIAGPGAGAPKVVCVGFAPASYTDPGDYSNGLDLDVGSPHIYWGGHEPNFTEFWDPGSGSWSNKACYNGALSSTGRYSRTVPLVCTESGYITGTGDAGPGGGQRHCPPDVAGEYLIRTLLQNYMGGIKRTYIFAMTHSDSGSGQPQFGLCDNNWTRLACFYAIKNLMALVGWEQGPDPNPFNVTMTCTLGANNVDQDGYQSPDRIDKLVLRRGQDEWLIILTRQRSIWNRGNQTYKTVTDPRTVVLQLPAGNWVAGVAEPAKNVIDSPNDGLSYANSTNGTAYAPLTVSGTDTVTLQLAGLTRVVRITRAAGDAPTGAIDVSGTKTSRRTLSNLPSGAIDVAGTKVESKRHSASRTGAVDVNGTVTVARTLASSVTGTVRVTGSKTERATHRSIPAIGALAVSGSRTEAWSKTYTDSRAGTVTLGGSIGESWKQVDVYHDVPAPGLADVNGSLAENYQVFNGEGVRTGTVTLRGSLGESWKQVDTYVDVPAPGLADVNGTLTRGVIKRDFPSGAISLGGDLSETWATGHDTDLFGDLTLDGVPGEASTTARSRTGAVALSGSVLEAWASDFVEPSGQLTLGGTMSSTYLHNDVVTGNLPCAGALADALVDSYDFEAEGIIGGSLDEFWTRGRLPYGRIEAGHATTVDRD